MYYNNTIKIHINFDPRYDKDEALVELEKDLNDEISKRVYGQIESLNFAISISPKLKEAFPKLPANNDLNEGIF